MKQQRAPGPGTVAVGADIGSAPLGIRRDASIYAIDGGWFRAR
jgi:hypothetical protein